MVLMKMKIQSSKLKTFSPYKKILQLDFTKKIKLKLKIIQVLALNKMFLNEMKKKNNKVQSCCFKIFKTMLRAIW